MEVVCSKNNAESLQEPGPSQIPPRAPVSCLSGSVLEDLDPCGQCTDMETRSCPQSGKRPRLSYTAPNDYRLSLEQRSEDEAGSSLLTQTSSELYLAEGLRSEVSVHEETQMEAQSSVCDAPISCRDIVKPLALGEQQGAALRAVLTVGVAGAGKTTSVLRFCLDWAQGSENQDLQLVVPLSFREMNLVSRGRYSLTEMVLEFHPSLQPLTPQALTHSNVLFICDGLDESRLPLDFNCEVITEVTQRSEVSMILVNLIRGDLLPEAQVWITSRPAAANQIPARCVQRITEVRGFFSDPHKERYFRTRFSDQQQLHTVLSHLRTSRSLRIMCQIPVFCSIASTVLDHMLRTHQSGALPQTLTDLYAHFLSVQMQKKKDGASELTSGDHELLLKLGRLAYEQLQKGNLTFYQEDLQQVGLDLSEASDCSGLCSEIFRRENVLFNKPVCSFVHLSVQEFLAAVHLLHCFNTKNNKELKRFVKGLGPNPTVDVFLRKALHTALKSPSGHLDLVVRFLHGLMLESNQRLLGDLLGPSESNSKTQHAIISSLKEMKTKASPDRSISIFHCLTELHDRSVLQQVLDFLSSEQKGEGGRTGLSATQCSALAHTLRMSEQVLDKLDLQSYYTSAEGRLRLVPAVRNCTQAQFCDSKLSKIHLEIVALALSSRPSHLRVLDLSTNPEVNSEMQALCEGLQSKNCHLESLRLNTCSLSASSCSSLASALTFNPSHLRVLDLHDNTELRDSGVERLCGFLQSPDCRLETLNLSYCSLTEAGCWSLASALRSGPSHLRVLDLQGNRDLQDPGVEHLCGFLKSLNCRLEVLSLYACGMTERCCSSLASALTSNPSHLRELDVGVNPDVKDLGVENLCGFLQSPDCRLEVLRLRHCGFSGRGCSSLVSALTSTTSHLRVLDLWANSLTGCDVQGLRELQQSPDYRLDELLTCC